MKKRKNENPGMMTADSLVSMAKESHSRIMNQAQAQEDLNRKQIESLSAEEKELVIKVKDGEELRKKMTEDYEIAEAGKRSKALKAIKARSASEEDVKSGKISLNQFLSSGESNDEIEQKANQEIEEQLSQAANVIREKSMSIKQDELELATVRVKIHNLSINPIRLIEQGLKEAVDVLSYQFELLSKEQISAHFEKKRLEDELTNIGGNVWQNLSIEAANRLQFDPTFPSELVPDLKEKLSQFENGDFISITLYGIGQVSPHGRLVIRREA